MTQKRSRKPKRPARPLSPPAHLSPVGAAEWARLAPSATTAGTLTAGTARAFELLCETLATERAATAIVAAQGICVVSAAKTTKPHPAVRTLEVARGQVLPLLRRFGLLPGRVSAEVTQDDEPKEPKRHSVWKGILQ
jgi:P27 family predicted phage terminase small subunit